MTGGIHEIPTDTPGRMFVCGKHHIGPDVYGVLTETGHAHVVCLVERHELEHRYDDYLEWLSGNGGVGATWLPVHDMTAPPLDVGLSLFSRLADMLRQGTNIVIHCAAGIGRAGTTAAGTLMVLGMREEDALIHVRAHRPMAGPQTMAQHVFLQQVQAHLDGTNTSLS